MADREKTALIIKDPLEALIESQTNEKVIADGEINLSDDWDDVYSDQDDQDAAIEQVVKLVGSYRNPIDLDSDCDNPGPSKAKLAKTMTDTLKGTLAPLCSIFDKMRILEEENAQLLLDRQQLERRIAELEKVYSPYETIPGMSNHIQTSKDHSSLSATVLIDGREVVVDSLSPQMSGWDFTHKVAEAAGEHPGNMIVMQHSSIIPDLPLSELGLGLRPFYAISMAHRRIEPGRSLKIELLGRGPLI